MWKGFHVPILIIGCVLGALVLGGIVLLVGSWIVSIPLAAVASAGLVFRDRLSPCVRSVCVGFVLSGIIIMSALAIRSIASDVQHPRDWDFLDFWLTGKIAVSGQDIYSPANFAKMSQGIHYGDDFAREVIAVGSKYPPPTVLLFLPLGFLGLQEGVLFWHLLQVAALATAILLCIRLFFRSPTAAEYVFGAGLFLAMPATRSVFWFAQTNFLLVLLIGAFWMDGNKVRAGLWLALGSVIKPIFFVLGGVLLVRRRWRALGLALLVLVFLAGLALLAVGPASYHEYFTRNPSTRAPVSIYLESANQSLLSTVLRLEGRIPDVQRVLWDPFFLGLAFGLTFVTFVISVLLRTRKPELCIGLFAALGLLIYPGTLAHYSVLLIPALLYLCSDGTTLGLRAGTCCVIVTAIYGLTGVRSGTIAILGNLLAWLVFAFLAWRQIRVRSALR